MSKETSDIEIISKADNVDMASPAEIVAITTITSTNPAAIITTTTISDITDSAMPTKNLTTNAQTVNGENKQQQQEQQQQQQPVQATTKTQSTSTTTTTTTTVANKDTMDEDPSMINFKVLYVLTQLCGLTLIVLVGSWIGVHLGGLGGTENPKLEFNWHPLLMTIGLIYLYGNSILIYRGFRTMRKKALKITHAAIHMTAFILTVIALKTVFDSHNLAIPAIPNMYSLHSWLGLSAVILFCMQYVAGFMAYMVPGLKETYKIAYMPLHIYFGLFGFVLALGSALTGLTEKAIFSIPNYSNLPDAGVMTNMIGVLLVVFGGLVIYLGTKPEYKRKPLPEDTALLTTADEFKD